MLSILIPVYNFPVAPLVNELYAQAAKENIDFEILLIDDGSKEIYKTGNRILQMLDKVKYTELDKNIGRSRIRNLLAEKAQYEYLLFMDCDAKVKKADYIKQYLGYCKGEIIVCGGTAYNKKAPDAAEYLRWYYGIKREVKTAAERNVSPNASFSTFNFLISKSIFTKLCFDESLVRYGHEDTLFGYELEYLGYTICHIDNQLIHLGLDSNEQFVFKTKQGIRNLYLISVDSHNSKYPFDRFKILSLYKKVSSLHFAGIIGILYKLLHKSLERNLCGNNPRLLYLDLLKLGYLCTHG